MGDPLATLMPHSTTSKFSCLLFWVLMGFGIFRCVSKWLFRVWRDLLRLLRWFCWGRMCWFENFLLMVGWLLRICIDILCFRLTKRVVIGYSSFGVVLSHISVQSSYGGCYKVNCLWMFFHFSGGFSFTSRCHICKLDVESYVHLFIQCSYAKVIWIGGSAFSVPIYSQGMILELFFKAMEI